MLKISYLTELLENSLITTMIKDNKVKSDNGDIDGSVINKIIEKITALITNAQNKLFNWFIKKLHNSSCG